MISARMLIKETARQYHIKESDILGGVRTKTLAEARTVAMYVCREVSKYSLSEIGKIFGRHHTTVLHAIHRAQRFEGVSNSVINSIIKGAKALENGGNKWPPEN